MRRRPTLPGLLTVALLVCACDDGSNHATPADAAADDTTVADAAPLADRGPGALSTATPATMPEAWYVEQAEIYFDTLDTRADPEIVPEYSDLVARWEWPPWLLLTGYGRDNMVILTRAALRLDASTVPERDCRFFPTQPFARCYVEFEYAEGRCPIYEEFTYSDTGEMTFIEAWSDLPGLLPFADPADRWGEATVNRLSTRVPGLGTPTGLIDPTSPEMRAAAESDPDVADLIRRTDNFGAAWAEAFANAPDNLYAVGCGWPAE